MAWSRSIGATVAAALLVLPAWSQPAAAPAQEFGEEQKAAVLQRMTRLIERNAFVPGVDFGKWATYLEGAQDSIAKAGTQEEFARAVNLALRNFGFSHIVLQSPRDVGIFRSGSTVGVGIATVPREEGLLVLRVVRDAPAEKAGLVPGDLILEVDGKKPEGISGISGPEGTQVRFKLKRRDGTLSDVTLTRSKFSTVRPEELTWLSPDTARLNVYTFGPGYSARRVDTLMAEAAKAKNLIVDLRDNPGGAVLNLQHLLGYFVSRDRSVGTFITRDMVSAFKESNAGENSELAEIARWSQEQEEFRGQQVRPARIRGERFTGRVAVLINGGSGSASEIFAAAVREVGEAVIVGQKSAGAVLVSVIVPAGHGFSIQYPLSDYVTFGGRRLEGNGIEPDVASRESRVRLPDDPDETIDKAKELLAKPRA
jgi:carboxyl-terminal processing protease